MDGGRRPGAFAFAAGLLVLMIAASAGLTHAQQSIPVPNGSFESPDVSGELYFAGPIIDSWQKTAEPPGYDTNTFGPWEEKTGVFYNLPNPLPIDNMDGFQGSFLTSLPGVGFFQDYESVGGTNSAPSNEFDATFSVGRSYLLTVGLATSSTFPVTEGATLNLRAYYRDGASNRVTVAERTVSYSTNVFTNIFHLLDHTLVVPKVEAGHPWAGEHIGIEFVSTVPLNLAGGFWDLDNVRLTEFISPTLAAPDASPGQFDFAVLSDPAAVLEVLATTNVSLAAADWTSLGMLTNSSGLTNFHDPAAAFDRRFYTVRQVP